MSTNPSSPNLRDLLLGRFRFVAGHADVWAWFADASLFAALIDALAEPFAGDGVTKVVGIEARGFLLGAPVALKLGAGFVAVRKDGGIFAGEKLSIDTAADYRGQRQRLRLQRQALGAEDRVILVDDWFETGSQALGVRELIGVVGATYAGASIIVDDVSPETREHLGRVHALLRREELGPDS